MPDRTVQIQLTGREAETRLPPLLTPAARSAGRIDDVFLPSGYLVATRAFDVSPAPLTPRQSRRTPPDRMKSSCSSWPTAAR